MAAVAAQPHEFLVAGVGHLGDLVVVGVVQTALGRVLDEIDRRGGVVGLAAGVPADALSSVAFAGSSVAQAFQANAPMPAMNAIAKSPVVSLRTVRFLTLVAIC